MLQSPQSARRVQSVVARLCVGLFALAGLYGALTATASPARAEQSAAAEAGSADAALAARLSALRIGEMRGLEVLDAPMAAPSTKFVKRSGAELSLKRFRGRVVLLNFWATWCAPCLREMPSLDRLAKAMKEGPHADEFELVALSIDRGDGRPKAFLKDNDLSLTFYHDPDGALPRALEIRAMPTTILIDRDGAIVARYKGDAEWDSAESRAVIEAVITSER